MSMPRLHPPIAAALRAGAVALTMALALWLPPAAASADEAVDPAAIRSVIEEQIAAFGRDDGPSAFSHASPAIRRQFGTPERFMQMVRQAYRAVYRPRATAFKPLYRDGEDIWQPVEIIGPDGSPVLALYRMERQPDGTWRIGGCVLLPLSGESA